MRIRSLSLAALGAAALALSLGAVPAQANRTLLSEAVLQTSPGAPPIPPPEAEIEGACGLAVATSGDLYVSDYYHRVVDVFTSSGGYGSQIALPGANPVFGVNTFDAVCGLALDAAGRLYANEWHQGVLRLKPTEATIDEGESTGVAVDAAGNLYVDDRTHVAKYAAPVQPGDAPVAEVGLGSLDDAYGLAVSASGAKVYVPDAASDTVKVYEPAVDPLDPAATIAPPGGFNSLLDAAVTVDPTNGHLLVMDNLQPGFEHPKAGVDEFDSSGAFLGRLPGAPIDGEPSGIAVDPTSGGVYVTSGNDEGANVFAYGAYSVAGPATLAPPGNSPFENAAAAVAPPVSGGAPADRHSAKRPRATASEVIQRGRVQVAVQAKLAPKKLPRSGTAPVRFSLSVKIASADGSVPPQLRRIAIEINRNGHIDPSGLPTCRVEQIQPSTTRGAMEACRRSLVGEGSFSAKVLLSQQAPFPSSGKILAFDGRWHGKPAILAHIFGAEPVPTSYTLPFAIDGLGKGTYGTALSASLPHFTSQWGYVTGISLNLGRSFSEAGRRHGYLMAGCPAPKGFGAASFPLAHASLSFGDDGPKAVEQTLTRSCGVRSR